MRLLVNILFLTTLSHAVASATDCAQRCAQAHCTESQCLASNFVCYEWTANECVAHPDFCWCGGTPLPANAMNDIPKHLFPYQVR